jgi:sulfite dehydrogenase (quinone) subunit SoeC
MHPAPSVILFSTLSGLGFGLLFWLGLGVPGVTGWAAFAYFVIAYLLAVGGLLSSTFHLGHPERALRAFTQWRTSWLSREGWAAVLALLVMAVFAAGLVFLSVIWPVVGIIGAVLSIATVYTTSMIYGQLKTVPRWNMSLTSPMFLSISLAGGALLARQTDSAMGLLVLVGIVQVAYWILGDRALSTSGTSMATATGLGGIGEVRAFEPPHTGSNYLMREMIYVVGRRHSAKLRVIALVLMVLVPLVLLSLSTGVLATAVAAVSHLAGVAASRWLFFAEAEHVVGLYYGKR